MSTNHTPEKPIKQDPFTKVFASLVVGRVDQVKASKTFELDPVHTFDKFFPLKDSIITEDSVFTAAKNLQSLRVRRFAEIAWTSSTNPYDIISTLSNMTYEPTHFQVDSSQVENNYRPDIPLMNKIIDFYAQNLTYDVQLSKYRLLNRLGDDTIINAYLILSYINDIMLRPGANEVVNRTKRKIVVLLYGMEQTENDLQIYYQNALGLQKKPNNRVIEEAMEAIGKDRERISATLEYLRTQSTA